MITFKTFLSENYHIAKQVQASLSNATREASKNLKKYDKHKNELGLTPDHIKATSEWKKDKAAYDTAFHNERKFNGEFNKKYKKEIKQERKNKK